MAEKKVTKEYFYSNGKRKTAVARVRLFPKGKGDIEVNGKPMKEFCKVKLQEGIILSPLKLVGLQKEFDITAKVEGGGSNAQAEAVRHGIAKALTVYNLELRPTLKHAGLLTRDSRVKERKKPGLKGARRSPQWCKR
jgi:small subunit ribosomal protein S9